MGCVSSQQDDVPPISLLNQDVLLYIFSYLNVRDRCRLARVCRRWQRLTAECSTIWATLDILPYEVNLAKNWAVIHPRFTSALKSLRLGANQYKTINCGITKDVMLHIRRTCPKLEELEIHGALLDSIDASDLPLSLKRLVIFKCSIRNELWFSEAIHSGGLLKLEHVDFDFSLYRPKENSNQIARELVMCATNVKSLSLRNLAIGDLQLCELPMTLHELSLVQCTVPRRWFDSSVANSKHIPPLNKLTVDIMRHNSWTTLCSIGCISGLVELQIFGADLRALDSANLPPCLQKLILRQVWLPRRWFHASAIAGNLHQLKYLELTKLRSFSQKCATDFRAFPNLKQLHVCKSYIDDTGMAYAVGHMVCLEKLTIINSCITDVSLALFGQYLSQLKHLRLRQCGLITDIGVQCVEDLKDTMKLLEIYECQQITAEGVIKLASNLKGSLQYMNVTADILGIEYCDSLWTNYKIHLHVTNPSKPSR
ncbi:uncharacterized protein [Amphiura filiformis]|uniref:uncharacterized protein n=1 Tax=Amphiura filiformis TaxID=82378 RepID=UPI003B2208DE